MFVHFCAVFRLGSHVVATGRARKVARLREIFDVMQEVVWERCLGWSGNDASGVLDRQTLAAVSSGVGSMCVARGSLRAYANSSTKLDFGMPLMLLRSRWIRSHFVFIALRPHLAVM